MLVENTLDNVDENEETVVKRHLVLTTRNNALEYFECFRKIPMNEIYFISGTFADDYKLNVRSRNVAYLSLKQIVQYNWIGYKFINHLPLNIGDQILIIFEQTFHGNIHYHILISSKLHRHDIRALIAELFGFTKANDIIINVNVKDVFNLDGIHDYMFNKVTKTYENLDMNVFKPIILFVQTWNNPQWKF